MRLLTALCATLENALSESASMAAGLDVVIVVEVDSELVAPIQIARRDSSAD
jgi:hypothetical protein